MAFEILTLEQDTPEWHNWRAGKDLTDGIRITATAATVIIAGMSGQMAGYRMMRASTVNRPMSQGISMGTASHAMGIAASLEKGRKFAAYASLGLIFNGILTAILVPILLPFMGVV